MYDQSLKRHRDIVNSLAYARQEGYKEGLIEMQLRIIKIGIQEDFTLEQISIATKLPIEQIKKIISENNLQIK